MKTTFTATFSAALVFCALTSCDRENISIFGRVGTDAIGIGSVKTTAPITKAVNEETSKVTLEDGSSFTIQKTVEPYMVSPDTKADIKDASSLTSFTLYGYLDEAEIAMAGGSSAEDKANAYFIQGANVIKETDKDLWHTEGEYFWRNNITHYFWAQSGATGMTTTDNSASFTKSAGSDEDILVAYASKKWNEDMCNDHKGDNLDLTFKHALSAAKFQMGTVKYQQHDATAEKYEPLPAEQANRVRLDSIKLIRMTEGTCNVTSDMNFTWDKLSKNGAIAINGSETILAMPQNDAALEIYYTDTYRTVTRMNVVRLDDHWNAGKLYNYILSGTITVPKIDEKPKEPGINPEFTGNEKRSEQISTSVDVTYYKTIEISWDNLPSTDGNKTYAMVYYGDKEIDVSNMDTVRKDPNMLLIYDAFHKNVEKIAAGGDIGSDGHCKCIINTESMTGCINIYIAYNGGSNGHSTEWILKNLTIRAIEYK